MKYYIEIRLVAAGYGLCMRNNKPISFSGEEVARKWARKHVTGKYIASWDVKPEADIKNNYNI